MMGTNSASPDQIKDAPTPDPPPATHAVSALGEVPKASETEFLGEQSGAMNLTQDALDAMDQAMKEVHEEVHKDCPSECNEGDALDQCKKDLCKQCVRCTMAGNCGTSGGNAEGAPCVFPALYDGHLHDG